MKIMIFNQPASVNEAELEKDLLKLPLWRRDQAMRYRFHLDRVLCSKSYLMLLQGIEETCGPVKDTVTFAYGKYGKPYLIEYPQIEFNLSHCKRGIICALNDSPVGCDIEEIPGQLDMELCRACFNETEVQEILNSHEPNIEFTKLWTKKEAFLKFQGLGLTDDLRDLFSTENLNGLKIDTTVCPEYGYVYSVVSNGTR